MARSARSHAHPDLFGGLSAPASASAAPAPDADELPAAMIGTAASRPAPVWVAVYLPSLALQALRDDCETGQGVVIIDDSATSQVLATNRAAREAGVLPGYALRAALALDAGLQVLAREPAREAHLLDEVANTLLTFTSRVSLQPPQAVLLEVRGSLRLFAGIERLLERIRVTLSDFGLSARYSVAPSATAAYWLVQAGHCPPPAQVVADGAHAGDFLRALNALDIALTGWPASVIEALQQMGVYTVADCRRLPRAGLTRRFGPEPLRTLANAFAELPEARRYLREQPRFESLYELDAEIAEAPQLQHGCEQLLDQLGGFLRHRQGATRTLEFAFHAWRGSAGTLTLALSHASYRREHWQRLLAAHLERCTLSQPAVAISLSAAISEPLTPTAAALPIQHGEATPDSLDRQAAHELLDRLRARLGAASVQALRHIGSHHPEQASQTIRPGASGEQHSDLPVGWWLHQVPAGVQTLATPRSLQRQRPLWLLGTPLGLRCIDGVLDYEGVLTLRHGPERIESAWWLQGGQVRDYFIAMNPAGARLWVYREYGADGDPPRWWLHGIFG